MENLFHILDCLLDSNLIEPEKKNDRREILDGILCSILQLSCHWNYSNVCLTKIVLPILRFEVKLLQRRNVSYIKFLCLCNIIDKMAMACVFVTCDCLNNVGNLMYLQFTLLLCVFFCFCLLTSYQITNFF